MAPNGSTHGSGSTVVGGFDFLGNHNVRLVRTERANERTLQIGAKSFKQYYSQQIAMMVRRVS